MGFGIEPTPGPTTFVIFGASGDLTRRKLLPAIYRLSRRGRLPAQFAVIGIARSQMDDEAFRTQFRDSLKEFAGAGAGRDEIARIAGQPDVLRRRRDRRSRALPAPAGAADGDRRRRRRALLSRHSADRLCDGHRAAGASGLADAPARGWRRIIVEKPFGTDLDSARALNRLAHQHFDEEQVYRIDHYLGKETVQNLLVFRFGNGMFEPVWNRRYIDHVQITAAETVGVEHRAAYYEGAGALRDMVQNHLMQVLSLVAMEPPIAFTAESVRDRKMDALLAVQPLVADGDGATAPGGHVVRAQYRRGVGERRRGARLPRREGRRPRHRRPRRTPPLRLNLDNWRWAGVPFYLRTGKRLPKRTTEIAIQFRRPPLEIFRRASQASVAPNLLIVNVQPDEGISLRFETKLPGYADADCAGDDELQVRDDVWRRGAGSVRDAAARRDARRSDALRPSRLRRDVMGAHRAGARRLARAAGRHSDLRSGRVGTARG